MAIVQISKIQQRSGNLVDLPQLDEAEFGFASDEKRLFIGKTEQGLENIEVLTSYSEVDFNQINGAYGNLNIDITSNTAAGANGQILAFDGNNWVNRGGNAGGLLTFGDISNIKITGGSIGYVLETDGTGNLSWTPKATIVAFIQNITKANPAVVTTAEDNFLIEGAEVTITDAVGMTQVNGNSYYIDILTANTFALYTDSALTTPLDTTGMGYTAYAYTSVTGTTASTNYVTVSSTSSFTANDAIKFIGTTFGGIFANQTYYVKNIISATEMTISLTEGGSELTLTTASGSCNVYATGGRAICAVGGGGVANAAGSNSTVQFNNSNLLDADADFTWNNNTGANPKILTVNGNANVGNLNATGVMRATRVFSNIASGAGSPLVVSSTDRVANLNVSYSNVTDFSVVTSQTTGTFYPVFVSSTSTSNQALGVNNAISFNVLTSNLSLTGNISVTANANVGNIGAAQGIFTSNITSLNANLGNLATANFITGTLTTQAQPNITSLGNGTQVTVAGNLNPNANITYNLGNSTNRWNDLYLSGNTIYLGNATIDSVSNGVRITNASGGSFTVDGTSASNSAAVVNGNSSVIVTANSNVNISSNGVANVLVITDTGANITGTANVTGNANVGNLGATSGIFTGNISVTGNANTGNIGTTDGIFTGNISVTSNANIGNIGTGGLITATGNITGGNIITAGVVTATGNITGGNLVTSGVVSATGNGSFGNVSATLYVGNISGTGNSNLGNLGITSGLFTNTLSVTGNSNIGNIGTAGLITATGNITGGNIVTTNTVSAGTITASGTITGGNLITTGNANVGILRVSGTSNLGPISNVTITGGNANQILRTDGTGNLSWVDPTGGYFLHTQNSVSNVWVVNHNLNRQYVAVEPIDSNGNSYTGRYDYPVISYTNANSLTMTFTSAVAGWAAVTGGGTNINSVLTGNSTPGGVNTQVQFNDAGALNGSSGLTFNKVTGTLSVNNVEATLLTTGANTTAGTITGNWTLSAGSRLQATYADLAEYYSADEYYEPGTVLEFGGVEEVTLGTDATTRVAGVVSTDPAYAMNAKCPGLHPVAIALQGRVPCKVRGVIKKGDMLISGGNGYARPTSSPQIGTVIGKALQNFDGVDGVIEIAVGRL